MSEPPISDEHSSARYPSGSLIGGRYTLKQKIAGGGMGDIWRALDERLQRRVAVKLLADHRVSSPDMKQRFMREAMAVARLHEPDVNPHVVQIYDYGVEKGDVPYIVMEFLDGEDLEWRLAGQKQHKEPFFKPAAVVPWLNQLAHALTSAHAAGVIHRDLKPANIFLARTGGKEVLKVLDFGLALLDEGAGASLQDNEQLAGTLRYMSPEQIRGQDLDHRTDLWSLAVVLYQLLTGHDQFPFSKADVLVAISSGTFSLKATPPAKIVPTLGTEMDVFFDRALHPDPAQRFSSAREMADAFSRLVDRLPTPPAKILVVDDEPDMVLVMQQRFRKQLQDSAYEFIFASNGEEALEKLRKHPDTAVVLSDLNMPKMDGLTFLGHVREVNSLVKVIIVSAYSDMRNIRTAMNRGACDFVVKPINFQDLKAILDKTVKEVRELRQLLRSTKEYDLLRMFVHNGVVERVLSAVRASQGVAGERVEGTVTFIDVKDFTQVTRSEQPEAVFKRLNANLEVIATHLDSQGGIVDFVGDAVMAVFQGKDHLERALDACLSARQQLKDLASRSGDQSPYIHGVCMGLASGELLLGSIGAEALCRLDYTVLGEVVNTAAWLASQAERDEFLIPEELALRLGSSFECMTSGTRALPGTRPPIKVHQVIGRREARVSAADATASVDLPKERESAQPLMAALKAM